MSILLLAVVFCVPVAAGSAADLFTFVRDRRLLRKAFVQGRAESVVRLPMPIEPMPVIVPLEVA